MDQFINEALRDVSITATTSVLDLLAAIVVSAFLSMVLSIAPLTPVWASLN